MLSWVIGFFIFGAVVIYLVEAIIWVIIAIFGMILFVLGVGATQTGLDQHNYLMFIPAALLFYFVYLTLVAAGSSND